MTKKNILFCKGAIGIFCFILMSCNDVDLSNISKDVQINESLVLPLGEGSIGINDILNQLDLKDQISIDEDTINFVTEINSEYQFLNINILENPVTTDLPFTIAPIPQVPANSKIPIEGTVTSVNLGLDPNSTTRRVDKIEITKFTFGINISRSNLFVYGTTTPISPSDLRIVLTFPKMFKSNTITPTPIDPIEVPITNFDQLSNVTINNFYMDTYGLTGTPISVQLFSGNREITVGASATLNLSVEISEIENIVAYGKFQLTSSVPTTIKLPLDMLSEIPDGLSFANPKATISLTHNIGTYMQFNIESIKAFSKDHSVEKQGLFYGSQSTTEVIDVKPETPGLFTTKKLHTLDRNYGTLDQLFDRTLDTLEYKFSLTTNDALNDASSTASYITPGMSVKANVKVVVPFYFKSGSNYTLTDTIPNLDIPFEYVENAILVLKVTNALPVKATLSMKFLDVNNNVISSSLNSSTYVINSGEVDDSGIVTAETVSPINIDLTKEQANEIKDAKSMIYSLVFEGNSKVENGVTKKFPIQITKNNYIKVKLGAFVNGSYSTTLGSNN
ncbi:MAG: hypothetical protein PHS59_04445 [Paludibacter sp.]|nr:hypothetical protein [Paludibacter sp.]